jgi:hypothetical protein
MYCITLTLRPVFYKKSLEEQYDMLYEELRNIIKKENDIRVTMIVECTKSYNIHAHGLIQLDDLKPNRVTKRKIHDLFRSSKIIGFIYLKIMEDLLSWMIYICKDINETRLILRCRFPILFDHLDQIPLSIYFKCMDEAMMKTIAQTEIEEIEIKKMCASSVRPEQR